MSNKKIVLSEELRRKRRSAGRRGGLQTMARHGREHYRVIGKKGAGVFHKRYELVKFGLMDFAIVNRETKLTVAFLSGMEIQS
jgi:hypothetical protein